MANALRKTLQLALSLLVAGLLLGSARPPVLTPAPLAPSLRPDVVLITIDTLRADALGFAGNRLPVAWNNLGVALYQLREPGAAFKAWQRAVDLQPDLWDTLWTLATKAAESGWNQLARISFERFLAKAPPDRYGEQLRKARLYLAELKRGRAAGLKSRAAS